MASRLCRHFLRYYSRNVKRNPPAGEAGDSWQPLKNEFDIKQWFQNPEQIRKVPRETDVLIIGGGAIGSSVAYWLKQRHPEGFSCVVVEKDPCYTRASTVLSVGGIRQQFSLQENIEMSLFSAKFLREIKEHLSVLGLDPPDVQFNPQGYLFLATEKGAETLKTNYDLQSKLGAKVDLMNQTQLKEKFPWLKTDDIELGTYGLENEGWFDPWALLQAFKLKAISLGTKYVAGECVGFTHEEKMRGTAPGDPTVIRHKTCNVAQIRTPDDELHEIKFCYCINSAGPWAGEVANMAGIGSHEGINMVPLPVQPRKRFVYMFHCPDGPGLECPMIIDPSGTYVRREGLGGNYICGASPEEDEVDHSHVGVEVDYFHKKLLPELTHRIPVFQNLQLRSAWAGFYDYNYIDQNLIIGNHPYYRNMFFTNGSSGHGIQHSPAIGRAIMELIIDDEFQTVNLSRLSFDRFLAEEPVFESNIV